jgi:hypothetical protein
MNERFEELLPWYVNGTLGAEERAWVDRYLVEHPHAKAEVESWMSLATSVKATVPDVPDDIGLAKAMQRIGADRPSWTERIAAFLGMRPAVAFAGLAIVAVQAGFIASLLHDREDEAALRTLKARPVVEQPMLKLNFAPDAREADIRHLLVSVQGQLAGGPGQLGDYYVVVPAGKEAALAEQLKTHPIVQAVSIAPGLPPRE